MKQLSVVLKNHESPSVPEALPNFVIKTDGKRAVTDKAAHLFSFYYWQVVAEYGEEQAAEIQRSPARRSKVSAEALLRCLDSLQGEQDLNERTHAYIMYQVYKNGTWTADESEPNSFEDWLAMRMTLEDEMPKTTKSYFRYFLNTLIPALRRSGGEDAVDELFTVKDTWRRATMAIPTLRHATSMLEDAEKAVGQNEVLIEEYKVRKQAVHDQQFDTNLEDEERAELRETEVALAKDIKRVELESKTLLDGRQKDLNDIVKAAVKVVGDDKIVSESKVIQQAIEDRVRKSRSNDGELPPESVDHEIYRGDVLAFENIEIYVSALPTKASMLMETLTRGTIEWRHTDIVPVVSMLLTVTPKSAPLIIGKYFMELSKDKQDKLIKQLQETQRNLED